MLENVWYVCSQWVQISHSSIYDHNCTYACLLMQRILIDRSKGFVKIWIHSYFLLRKMSAYFLRPIFSYSSEQCQLTISHSRHPGSQMHSNQSCLISPGWLSQPLTVTDWSVLRQPDIDMETTLMRTDLWDPARVGVWQSCQAFCLLGSSAEIKIKGRAKEIKAVTTYRTERYSSCLQMAINNLYNNSYKEVNRTLKKNLCHKIVKLTRKNNKQHLTL